MHAQHNGRLSSGAMPWDRIPADPITQPLWVTVPLNKQQQGGTTMISPTEWNEWLTSHIKWLQHRLATEQMDDATRIQLKQALHRAQSL